MQRLNEDDISKKKFFLTTFLKYDYAMGDDPDGSLKNIALNNTLYHEIHGIGTAQ
jgi:hypothetical protein